MNDFNCFNIHYCSLLCEKILTFYVCFFSSIFQDRAVVATLKYFGCKTVNDVSLPSKEMEKEEFGMELFSKEYVKIKDPKELISKGNLTDSEK